MCLAFEIWKLLSERHRRIDWSVLEVSTSRADERNWHLRTDLGEKVGFGESSIFSQGRWSWCWFFFMVSQSWLKASSVHHVAVPGFVQKAGAEWRSLPWHMWGKEEARPGVWDMAASAARMAPTGEPVASWSQGKDKQASLQIWRRIMATTGKETLMWMSGLLNMSVRVGNNVSLSLMHTSSWSIPCTSLHGIRTYPRKIRRALCIFLTVLAQSSDLMVCMQFLCNMA